MDSASVLTIVTALISSCANALTGLHTLAPRFRQSSMLISSLSADCTILRISLTQIESLLKSEPEDLSSSQPRIQHRFGPCIDVALAGCSLVLSALEEELGNLGVEGEGPVTGGIGRRGRRAVVWDEARMKEMLGALRGQQGAVMVLGVLLQIDSVDEMRNLLKAKHTMLYNVSRRTGSLREQYPRAAARAATMVESITDSESVFEDAESETFAFDEDVLESGPYQRLALTQNGANPRLDGLTLTSLIDSDLQQLSIAQPRQNSMQSSGQNLVQQQRAIALATNRLRHAIAIGDKANAATLLKQGAEIFGTFEYAGQTITLLHSAASHGHIEIVKLLLAYQHDINIGTPETGSTALHVAVIKDHPNVVRLLLDCGADPECKMHKQLKPGEQPIASTSSLVSQEVTAYSEPILKTIDNWTGFRPLHCAAIYNRPESARHLLAYGAEVDSRSTQFLNTPLHLSTVFGNSDVTEVLLKYGANQAALDNSSFPVFKLGPSHSSQRAPRAWGPSLHGTAQPANPFYYCRYIGRTCNEDPEK